MRKQTIKRDLLYRKPKVIFRPKCRPKTLSQFRDSLEKKFPVE